MGCAGTSSTFARSYYICYTFSFLLVCFTTSSSFCLSCVFFCFCFPVYTELNSLRIPPWSSSLLLASCFPYHPSTKITQPVSWVGSYAHIHHEFVINLLFYLSIKQRHRCPLLLNLLRTSQHLDFEKHSSTLENQFIFLLISPSCS